MKTNLIKFCKYESSHEKIYAHKFNYSLNSKYNIHTTNGESEQIKKKK